MRNGRALVVEPINVDVIDDAFKWRNECQK
jgi:hypothetical protein